MPDMNKQQPLTRGDSAYAEKIRATGYNPEWASKKGRRTLLDKVKQMHQESLSQGLVARAFSQLKSEGKLLDEKEKKEAEANKAAGQGGDA